MGARQSAEEPPPEAQLFDPNELAALRKCFVAIASHTNGVLAPGAFDGYPHGMPWVALLNKMGAEGPVRWPTFLATIAQGCKGRRSGRLELFASLYVGPSSPAPIISEAALMALLVDALIAAHGGDASVASEGSSALKAVAADVLCGHEGGVPIQSWVAWVSSQLPGLPIASETFLLQYLIAVGQSVSGGAAGGATVEVPAAALNGVQEPLLRPAAGQEEGHELLEPTSAWLLSLSMGMAGQGEAAEWRCLYASRTMGLSMNRFSHHAEGYAGPTLLVALTERGELFGAYIDTPLKQSDKYFGGAQCTLFTLRPSFHVYRATGIAKNYVLYNPPRTGQLSSTAYFSKSDSTTAPEVLGFGGQTARFRMCIEDDMKALRWHGSDTTYATHAAEHGAPRDGLRQIRALELWGCGGADADKVLQALRERRVRDAGRAGKVDRAAMFGIGKGDDWRAEDNPDRMILETAGAHTFYSAQLEKLPDEPPHQEA